MSTRRGLPAGSEREAQGWRRFAQAQGARHLLKIPALVGALALALVGVGIIAVSAHPAARTATHAAAHTTPARQLIERIDLHVDDLPGSEELEVNLALSQTIDDCGHPLNGEFCLRYSIMEDDTPVQAGYGLIPSSAVSFHGPTVKLNINTSVIPGFVRTAGSGGKINLTWVSVGSLPQVAAHASFLADTTVHGNVLDFTVPSTNVTAAVVVHGAP